MTEAIAAAPALKPARSQWADVWRQFRSHRGAMVALLVDRVRAGEPAMPAPFLGDAALFPTSPWLIASALKVPVQLGFGLYRGGNRYDLVFETFSDGVAIERHNRPAILAALPDLRRLGILHRLRQLGE